MVVLETPRLVLRRIEPDDLDALCALYRDPEVRRYIPEGVLGREETREEMAWHLHGHRDDPDLGLWATIERASGAFLGRCWLLPWDVEGRREVELAYLIDRARWGEGFATEAARGIVEHATRVLRLPRLVAFVMPGNVASERVAMNAGLAFEREAEVEGDRALVYARRLSPPDASDRSSALPRAARPTRGRG